MKKDYNFWLITLAVVFLDQFTKFVIRVRLNVVQSVPVIKNIFHVTYVQNTGAGFGILQNQHILLSWFSIIVIGVILYYYDKALKDEFTLTTVALIFGGAIGNLIDRIAWRYVIDFIDFRVWPAFNVADSALTIGVLAFVIYQLRKEKKAKKKSKKKST
jgi:signal peptidase II